MISITRGNDSNTPSAQGTDTQVQWSDRRPTRILGEWLTSDTGGGGTEASIDPERLTAFGVGSVIVLPGNPPHFHWARSREYITQVTALGPLGLNYINQADDPRRL